MEKKWFWSQWDTARAGKIRISGTRKFVLLKISSGERCAPRNFVLLATLGGIRVLLIVYLAVHHMKYIMERQMLKKIHVQLYSPGRPH